MSCGRWVFMFVWSCQAMEQDVDTTKRENTELKSWSQEAEAGLRTMTEDAQR